MKTPRLFSQIRGTVLLLILGVSLLFSLNTAAASLRGEFKTSLIYEKQAERWQDKSFLELDYQQDINFDLNYYLKGRFSLESYYQNDEKKRETDFEIREAYLNYYTDSIDWRLGRQNFSWGSSYNLNPLNYFNPPDQNNIDPFNRKAVDALRADYYPNFEWQLTGVLSSHAETEESQTALRLMRRRWRGYDISASIFSGNSLMEISSPRGGYYPELNKFGIDLKGDLGSQNIGLFSEFVFSDYRADNLENTNELIIGIDYKFENNLYLLGQYYYQQLPLTQLEENQLLMLRAEKPFAAFHNWEVNLLSDLKTGMTVLRPKINFSLQQGLDLETGAVIKLDEKQRSRLNQLNQEMIYVSLSKYF